MRYIFLSILLYVAMPVYAQQKYELHDSTYWSCADSGRLVHVYPESTVTVQTTAKGFTFTAIHFEKLNERYGWVGGNDEKGNVVLMRTIDGGKKWDYTIVLRAGAVNDKVERIQSIKGRILCVLLRSGKILRSHDWGCTYYPISTPIAGTSCEQGKQHFEESLRYFEERLK